MTVDDDHPLTMEATLTISDIGIHADYSGSSAAVRRGINVPLAYTMAYTVFGLGCVVATEIPNNAGSLAPLTVSAPAGCVLNALKPAPVSSRHVLGQMLPDMVFGCLRQAIPDRVPAEGASCIWSIMVRGEWQERRGPNQGYALAITSNGGTGGRPAQDGLPATAFPSGAHDTSVEIAEIQSPLMFWRKEFRPGSGGAGQTEAVWGRSWRSPIPRMQRSNCWPPSTASTIRHAAGMAASIGAAGYVGLASGQVLRGKGLQVVSAGERLVVLTPGGGGLGDPRLRDPAKVKADLRNGLASAKTAARLHGALHTAE